MIFKVQLTRDKGKTLAQPAGYFVANILLIDDDARALDPKESGIEFASLSSARVAFLFDTIMIQGFSQTHLQTWVLTPLDKEPAWGKDANPDSAETHSATPAAQHRAPSPQPPLR